MSKLKLTPAQVAEARALLIADVIEAALIDHDRLLRPRPWTYPTDAIPAADLDWLAQAAAFTATGLQGDERRRDFALRLARVIVTSGL